MAIGRADLVIVTGGLGPTQDDLTREALAEAIDVPLVRDDESLAAIEAFFARRNRAMTERNRVQALRPEGSEAMANPVGTAPGIWLAQEGRLIACLPGVPSEMKTMFDGQVVPRLRGRPDAVGRVIVHRVINLFGKGEAEIREAMALLTLRRGAESPRSASRPAKRRLASAFPPKARTKKPPRAPPISPPSSFTSGSAT